MSATAEVADRIRERVPDWVEDRLYTFMWVFGDPHADPPGRHIICDGLTDHPIITANVNGMRLTIELGSMTDRGEISMVIAALETFGALDTEPPSTSELD